MTQPPPEPIEIKHDPEPPTLWQRLFRRGPKPPSRLHSLAELWSENPGVWFEYPENTLVLAREAFLLYDVQGDPETGRVQIRRKPVPA